MQLSAVRCRAGSGPYFKTGIADGWGDKAVVSAPRVQRRKARARNDAICARGDGIVWAIAGALRVAAPGDACYGDVIDVGFVDVRRDVVAAM